MNNRIEIVPAAKFSTLYYRDRLCDILKREDLDLFVDDCLLFWPHHLEAFETGFSNGHKKEGAVRYKLYKIRVPSSNILPVYEASQSSDPEPIAPFRGIVTIDKVVVARPGGLTKDEILSDGFRGKTDMVIDMRQHYPDLKIDSWLTLYKLSNYNPKPTKKEVKRVLEASKI